MMRRVYKPPNNTGGLPLYGVPIQQYRENFDAEWPQLDTGVEVSTFSYFEQSREGEFSVVNDNKFGSYVSKTSAT